MEKRETELGIEYLVENCKIFFGNKELTEERLLDITKQTPIQFMNQIHSTEVLDFKGFKDYECDGLTTTKSQLALAIRTADCLPIIIKDKERIFAIHAGWRGLVEGILFSTQKFAQFDDNTLAIIGPHIHVDNFEVGLEVIDQAVIALENRKITFERDLLVLPHKNTKKAYLNLSYLAECHLQSINVSIENILQTKVDTFSDENWHSYRRDASNAGRNIHLVLKN